MPGRSLATVALAGLAASGLGAAEPARIVTLMSSSEPRRPVSLDLSALGSDAQTIELGQGPQLAGGGQTGTINCRHWLDLKRLRNASLALLRSHHLEPNPYESEGQLVVVTNPRISSGKADYYSFTVVMAPCSGTCRLKVSAWKMVAPFDGTTLRTDQQTKQNDDISGDLFDVGETEFNKCA